MMLPNISGPLILNRNVCLAVEGLQYFGSIDRICVRWFGLSNFAESG